MIKVGEHYIDSNVSDIITELKRQLELNGIKRFYKVIDTPKNLMICCPFHKDGQERKPSMGILKSDGTCHCFTCGWVGSLSEMVSNCFGYDDWGKFGDKWLLKNFLAISIEERKGVELNLSRGRRQVQPAKYVSEEELDKYRYYHPYWKERKITDERIIELFDLGYDADTNCITFPIRDIHGDCLFIARRNVRTKFFNYPEGVEKPLYGLYELYQQEMLPNDLIVCESMIDALTAWQYGKYAVALNGLGNNLQFEQLRRLSCRHLILATDNDEAGAKARYRIKQNIHNKLLTQYIFPKNRKDLNDLSREEFLSLTETFL